MPLNTSGPISIGGPTAGQSINLEFARTATQQTSMSQLYRGGAIVPNATANNAVPTSGAISLSQLRGATRRIQVTVDITANQTNYVFNTAKVPGYVAGITDVIFNIASGVIISASSTGVYAGNVDTSWNSGDTIRINNNGGVIVGVGGVGGVGSGLSAGSAGAAGGPAFIAQRAITFNNAGTIAGGGGGGGGGQGTTGTFSDGKGGGGVTYHTAGGGGGGRSSAAANSAGGAISGGTGTYSTPGAGGPRQSASNGTTTVANATGAGGAGGGWGSAGAAGTTASFSSVGPTGGPYGGGAGGVAVAGNGNISWIATGTRLGAIT